jgi:hypothetical protein
VVPGDVFDEPCSLFREDITLRFSVMSLQKSLNEINEINEGVLRAGA